MSDSGTSGFKPGQNAPVSGFWADDDGKEVALSKGDNFPPTRAGGTYHLVQATEHQTPVADEAAEDGAED